MLRELINWMARYLSAPHLFQYITFRTIMAALTALAVSLLMGPMLIRKLGALKAGQVVRSDGPQTHLVKAGTPTMGGVMILLSVAVATLLWADLHNRYVWVVLAVMLAFGAIGFYDDYRKLVLKDSRGLASRSELTDLLRRYRRVLRKRNRVPLRVLDWRCPGILPHRCF